MRSIPWESSKVGIEHHSSTEAVESFAPAERHVETAKAMRAVECLGEQIRRHEIQHVLATVGRIHHSRQSRKIRFHQILQ